jgi:hypothetical protein
LLLHLIQKHTGASPDGKTHDKNDHILIENDSHLYLTSHLLKELTDNGHYLVVAKCDKRLPISKQATQKFDINGEI